MKTPFQKFLQELRPYKAKIILVILLGAVVSALKGATPALIQQLVDVAWGEKNQTLAWQIPLVIAAFWILSGIARYFHVFWMRYISFEISVKLRRLLMDKYLRLNLSFFQKFSRGQGGLISRMMNDIFIVQTDMNKLADFLREPFMAIFSLAYLIYIDWKLVLFVAVALPLISFASKRLGRSLKKYSHRSQEAMEDLTHTLKESLDGSRIIRSFNLEEELRERFSRQADSYLDSVRKIISREEASSPISESLAALAQAAILIYVGQQVFKGDFSLGDFTGFLFAVGLLQDSVKKIQYSYVKLQQTMVALNRLYNILDSTDTIKDADLVKPFPKDWKTIEFKNVSFAFDKKPILKNINLKVRRGEVIAIVGASGGGKSTLVNLLERFYDPIEGEILIGDTPIKEISLKELRSQIALVTQDVFLFSDTVEKNIMLGNSERSQDDVVSVARLANAHEFIMGLEKGYQTKVGDRGELLSGGEKQRISIARAFFKDAPILILDEATSALDSASEEEVQKGIDHLMEGRTVFVIAHRLSTIVNADRIVVLKDGIIVEEGTHEELIKRGGEYFKFYSLQTKNS